MRSTPGFLWNGGDGDASGDSSRCRHGLFLSHSKVVGAVSVRSLEQMQVPSLSGLVNALQPTHLVLRPREYRYLMQKFPETVAKYDLAAHIKAAPGLRLRHRGYAYRVFDDDFRILRRTRDFDQVVRP